MRNTRFLHFLTAALLTVCAVCALASCAHTPAPGGASPDAPTSASADDNAPKQIPYKVVDAPDPGDPSGDGVIRRSFVGTGWERLINESDSIDVCTIRFGNRYHSDAEQGDVRDRTLIGELSAKLAELETHVLFELSGNTDDYFSEYVTSGQCEISAVFKYGQILLGHSSLSRYTVTLRFLPDKLLIEVRSGISAQRACFSVDLATEDYVKELRSYAGELTVSELFTNVDSSKGLEIFVSRIAQDAYTCALLPGGTHDLNYVEQIAVVEQIGSVSVTRMKEILKGYDLPDDRILIIPYQSPLSSYAPIIITDPNSNSEITERYEKLFDGRYKCLFSGPDVTIVTD